LEKREQRCPQGVKKLNHSDCCDQKLMIGG
jgi:hypothetical protein